MLTSFRRRLRRRQIPPHIELIEDGFDIVEAEGERHSVRWGRVTRVVTYKLDHFATDEIILGFESMDLPGTTLQASEEWDGFSELRATMEHRFGISSSWFADVMKPAFVRNFRVLYERPDAGTLSDRSVGTG